MRASIEIRNSVAVWRFDGEIIRTDRRFAVAAGNVKHVRRLAKSGIAPAQLPYQTLAVFDRGAQMRGAGREIAVVQVVRFDPAGDEGAH